jgi:hypothetical protein
LVAAQCAKVAEVMRANGLGYVVYPMPAIKGRTILLVFFLVFFCSDL